MPHLTSSNSNIQQKMKELKNMEVINIKNEKNDLKINLLPKKEKEIKENINLEMGRLIEMEKVVMGKYIF